CPPDQPDRDADEYLEQDERDPHGSDHKKDGQHHERGHSSVLLPEPIGQTRRNPQRAPTATVELKRADALRDAEPRLADVQARALSKRFRATVLKGHHVLREWV